MKTLILCLTGSIALTVAICFAADEKKSSEPTEKPSLDSIKKLVGEWVEIDENGRATDRVVSAYRVTAGGSAVHEVVFPGSEHEMITIYYQVGDDLMLTHYCVLGNQPRMRARRDSKPGTIVFECIGGTNVKSENDSHMHRGTITWIGEDRIRSEWQQFENGEIVHTAGSELVRKRG